MKIGKQFGAVTINSKKLKNYYFVNLGCCVSNDNKIHSLCKVYYILPFPDKIT